MVKIGLQYVVAAIRTNGVGLDLHTVLNVGAGRVVGFLVSEDGLSAQSVDEGGSACGRMGRTGSVKVHWLHKAQRRLRLGASEASGADQTNQCQMLRRP